MVIFHSYVSLPEGIYYVTYIYIHQTISQKTLNERTNSCESSLYMWIFLTFVICHVSLSNKEDTDDIKHLRERVCTYIYPPFVRIKMLFYPELQYFDNFLWVFVGSRYRNLCRCKYGEL